MAVPAVWDPYESDHGDPGDFRALAGWTVVRWLNRQTGWRRIVAKSVYLAPVVVVLVIMLASLIH